MKRWKLYCSFSLKCWPYYLTASATVYFQLWIKNVKFNNEYFWLSFSGEGCKQSNVSFLFSLKNKDNVAAFIAPVYKNNMYHKFAIFSSPSYGPTFGFGLDLFISNDSRANQQSFTEFGNTYQPPAGYVSCTQKTQFLLAGSQLLHTNWNWSVLLNITANHRTNQSNNAK